ncbi:MAG TPA: 2-amino-4-hydroxy-6-hydroxymethyldihydropteridine diphosphokinase [Ktedonobacterales bacterium]
MWWRRQVFIGLGSNLGDRYAALRRAVELLQGMMDVGQRSSVWDTAPELVLDQPRYLNAVVSARTDLDPFSLLNAVKEAERTIGRAPGVRYGPRLIDIDILLYDAWRVESRELVIPHPMLAERAFALAPLAELAPDLPHPFLGTTIAELLERVPYDAIVREQRYKL